MKDMRIKTGFLSREVSERKFPTPHDICLANLELKHSYKTE